MYLATYQMNIRSNIHMYLAAYWIEYKIDYIYV